MLTFSKLKCCCCHQTCFNLRNQPRFDPKYSLETILNSHPRLQNIYQDASQWFSYRYYGLGLGASLAKRVEVKMHLVEGLLQKCLVCERFGTHKVHIVDPALLKCRSFKSLSVFDRVWTTLEVYGGLENLKVCVT